jgi:hypothetical protein
MRDIIDDNKILEEFIFACDDLINSRFIVAERKITNVLKVLVSNEALFDIIKFCFIDFNFSTEWEKISVKSTSNNYRIVMPRDSKIIIALVVNLLYEFDRKSIEIHKFLIQYFNARGDAQDAFNSFCRTFILPFKKAIAMRLSDSYIDPEPPGVDLGESESDRNVPSEVIEKAVFILRDIHSMIISNPLINNTEKNDYTVIVEGLKNALLTKDSNYINKFWIAFKYTLKNVAFLSSKINELHVLLKLYIN